MKKLFFYYLLLLSISALGQNSSELIIDNVSNLFSNISFPYWLKSGQTINIGTNTKTVSVVEFNVDNNSLEFSQVLSINSIQTVPTNKVWKIESVGLNNTNSNLNLPISSTLVGNSIDSTSIPTLYQSPKKFQSDGIYNWKVPPGITSICVEAWGAGGHGFGTSSSANVGGGGGYGYQCLTVIPGTTYEITIGGPTLQVDTRFGNIIIATRGSSGNANGHGIGGSASSSINGIFVINGGNGINNIGGSGGNGGSGALVSSSALRPGGGGGLSTSFFYGAAGAVHIYW